jgi:hypothetical protein
LTIEDILQESRGADTSFLASIDDAI